MILSVPDRAALLDGQKTVKVALQPLREFLARVRLELRLQNADIAIRLVSDAEIRRLNKTYRKINKPTDVLSFPPAERRIARRSRNPRRSVDEKNFLGDIAISPATARRYARKSGRSFTLEMQILILHGVLHLLGYDHEVDHGEMDHVEARLRQRFGLL